MPFFKRAQIAAADLALAGLAPADDLDRLTLFADNLVPHVLRHRRRAELRRRARGPHRRGQLLEHDSPEEVEIRACALHAVELLVAGAPATDDRDRPRLGALERGARARATRRHPRHRARTTAY